MFGRHFSNVMAFCFGLIQNYESMGSIAKYILWGREMKIIEIILFY